MKPLDRLLRWWRCAKASSAVPPKSRLLDIGCGDGWFLNALHEKGKIAFGVGVDPSLESESRRGFFMMRPGTLPRLEIPEAPFDVISMIAVLEHIPENELHASILRCHELLARGGRAVLTVPSPRVDDILRWLIRLGLAEGMHVEEHHGYDVERTGALFESAGFILERREKFQCGLNNLFVFQKPPST